LLFAIVEIKTSIKERARHKPGSVSGVYSTTLAVIYLGYMLPNTSCGTHLKCDRSAFTKQSP